MKTYADTSFLVPLFVRESTSPAAIDTAEKLEEPLPIVFLHSVELINAMHARVFRDEISRQIATATFRKFAEYLDLGAFLRREIGHEDLRRESEALSHQYTARHGTRTLDLMHLAAARLLDCTVFLSFDRRQLAIAREEGFQPGPG